MRMAHSEFVQPNVYTFEYTFKCTDPESTIVFIWQIPRRPATCRKTKFFQDNTGKCQMSWNLPIQFEKGLRNCRWTYIYYIYTIHIGSTN